MTLKEREKRLKAALCEYTGHVCDYCGNLNFVGSVDRKYMAAALDAADRVVPVVSAHRHEEAREQWRTLGAATMDRMIAAERAAQDFAKALQEISERLPDINQTNIPGLIARSALSAHPEFALKQQEGYA